MAGPIFFFFVFFVSGNLIVCIKVAMLWPNCQIFLNVNYTCFQLFRCAFGITLKGFALSLQGIVVNTPLTAFFLILTRHKIIFVG